MAEISSSHQPEDQPDPKRQKMSTTTTSGDEENLENASTVPRKPKYKLRKVAIFFAYCGVGYQGMQKNPGAKTIEGDLEEALYFAGAVPEADRGKHKRYDWARSARTDKGVSAVGQVVSGKFYVDPPGFVERLNSNLSPQIRIFGYKRTTPSFSAKKFCDRRRYVYLIPVFAFDPMCHRDRESVLASVGSGNELVKCLECSERGRKVFGVMGKRTFESKTVAENAEIGSGISSNNIGALEGNQIVVDSIKNYETGKNDSNKVAENVEIDSGISSSNGGALEENKIALNSSENNENGKNDSENLAERVETGSGILQNNVGSLEENKVAVDSLDNNETIKNDTEKNTCHDDVNVEDAQNERTEEDKPFSVDSVILTSNATVVSENDIVVKGNGDSDSKNTCSGTTASLETEAEAENTEKTKENEMECEIANHHVPEKKSKFCFGEKEKERFNRILKHYEGTHNFHNFTTRTKAEDPSAKRYILSFNANDVVNINGIDFVKCEVVGQSFMLHQIRKMIGLAVAIMRNCSPESLIETALQQNVNINVPMAPEVGLYLDECFFPSYNRKWKDTHEEVSMKAYAEEAEDFKMKYIYPHIASTEHKDGAVALWLHSLNYRNYPDLRAADTTPTANMVADDCPSSNANGNEALNMVEGVSS